jgi:peptidoglycan/xylan/chitin deacetylase (PgdA/CDA1 family)
MSRILSPARALTVLAVLIAGCVTADVPPSEAVSQLAPTGRLRAALARDDAVSRDVARELARRLRVRLEATTFDAPFDVAFVVPEAARAAQLDFTAPYIILDGRPQVIALARGRPQAGEYVRDFLDELKASGFVAASIERNTAKGRASAP